MTVGVENRGPFGTAQWGRLEELINRFEAAWLAGPRPHLDDYLPPDGPDRGSAVEELAHADLEFRIRAGEAARGEEYFARYPELAADPARAAALVAREYAARRRAGPPPSAWEYAARFPHLAARLAELLAGAADATPRGDAAPAVPSDGPNVPRRCPVTRCWGCSAVAAWGWSTVPGR